MTPKVSRGAQLFCSLFIVIGLVAVGIGVWLLIKSIRSENWPVTGGIVQSAEIESHSGHRGSTTYSADVTYSYQVAGTNYTSSKVAIGQMSSSAEYAQGILNRYPAGKKVSVHYSPDDPSDAVLETGIHGGMWICLGVGTAFTLVGVLFLQVTRAAMRAQMSGAPQSSSVTARPDGSVTMNKPPVLMGVIFLLAGAGLCFVPPDHGKPGWLMFAVGGVFASGGLMALLYRLENKVYSKIAMFAFLLAFLAIFHWVSFGAGERIGAASTPFSVSHLVNVRTPFAIFTILLDVIIVAGCIHWLLKRPVEETTGFPGKSAPQNKLKLMLVMCPVLLLALTAIFLVMNHKTPSRALPAEAPLFPRPLMTHSGSILTAAVPANIASSSRLRRRCWWCVKVIMHSIPRTAWACITVGLMAGLQTCTSASPNWWQMPTARIIRTQNFPKSGRTGIGPIAMM